MLITLTGLDTGQRGRYVTITGGYLLAPTHRQEREVRSFLIDSTTLLVSRSRGRVFAQPHGCLRPPKAGGCVIGNRFRWRFGTLNALGRDEKASCV
jgi:hypothetical protein